LFPGEALLRTSIRTALIASFLFAGLLGRASGAEPYDLVHDRWPAQWIAAPGVFGQSYGVYHFRRAIELTSKPDHFVIHVSGDNRYQLYVNGALVSWGPARSDLTHWYYETVDIAPQLTTGKNVLAAVVWNDGPYKAVAQNTNETGFLLQADRPENAAVNTNKSWKCVQDKAYAPQLIPKGQIIGYYALGANERFDAYRYPWGWRDVSYNDASWLNAIEIGPGAPRDSRDSPNRWMLVERPIPLEELKPERIASVRRAEGIKPPDGFPKKQAPVTVPAHTTASLLLDQTYLTTGYPELTMSGGKDSILTIRYAETLYTGTNPIDKGNRSGIEGKTFYGYFDTYISDGGSRRVYRPLYWRTWRYIKLDITTEDQPLTIDDFHGEFSAYPFVRKASLTVEDPKINTEIQKILDTGWRTARLCAHETYMDCPYYEQLQYAGDARIQMMISLYMTGDSRLMRNGIALLNSSRTAEGATYSRAPSHLQQYIPPFSLWWIGMVHDYWMYVNDPGFVKEMLPGVEAVLSFYERYQKPDGSLRRMPWWNFVDWVKQWPEGVPPAAADGSSSAALDLQLVLAYQWAADLEKSLASRARASEYRAAAEKLKATVLVSDWDAARGIFADQPSHRTYSQQANTLAVLARIVPPEQARGIVQKVVNDNSLAQASIYFRAYMNATLREVGLGGEYLAMLGPWRDMMGDGLTTWAEWNGSDARSDCHAWGASPNIELFRTLAGIESAAPGFSKVRIAPNPGTLRHVIASMPHPAGEIRVDLRQPVVDIDLPVGIEGQFVWDGISHPLHPGRNRLKLAIAGQGVH
jgi:hypothetical protein